jgi:hypothetical protein
MFPNVRLLIAAVVASIVALSCGFAMFAAFRVNHEPLSRLAAGAAPLQLAARNLTPGVAMPVPADSFGNRFPLHQADSAGASPEVTSRQPGHDDSVEPPSVVAGTTATAPATDTAEPAQPAPVAPAPAAMPDAKPDEVAVAPSESPPATPSEPAPAATATAATEPPAEPAAPAEQAAPMAQASQESNQESNTDNKSDTATTTAAEPPAPQAHPKAAHRHRVAAKAQHARQARLAVLPGSQPSAVGGPFVPPPSRIAARPQRASQARATVQPVSQPSGVGGPFVPPTGH